MATSDRESNWRAKSEFHRMVGSEEMGSGMSRMSGGTPKSSGAQRSSSGGTPRVSAFTPAGSAETPRHSVRVSAADAALQGAHMNETRAAVVAPLEEARFAATVLRAAGASTAHARLVASALASADVRGKTRHGVLTLPSILNSVSNGTIDPRAVPDLVNDAAALAWVNGGDAFGQVIGHYCMTLAIYKAQELGIGVVFSRSDNDIGYPGWYTSMALKKSMIGLCFSSTHDKPVSMSAAAAGDPDLAVNRLSASAPCSDANNFELQLSWRLALPPQTLTPRLPAELRRATSSDLLLQEGFRPPPGACGHDPRKGFLAALAVEGLCGFVGGLRYDAHLRFNVSKSEPYPTFDAESYGESRDSFPTDGYHPSRSPLVSILTKGGQGRDSAESSPGASGGSSDSPGGYDAAGGEAGGGRKGPLTEVPCSQTPPSDVSAIDECACAEGEEPRLLTPTPHQPPQPLVRCLPADKVKAGRPTSRPKRVTLDVHALGEASPYSSETSHPFNTVAAPPEESPEEDDDAATYERRPSFLDKEPPGAQDDFPAEEIHGERYGSQAGPESQDSQRPSDAEREERGQSAHCFIAVDPEALEPGFPLRLGGLMRHMTSQEPLDPARPVMVPGDPERMSILRAQRLGGVRFFMDDVVHLNVLAERMGVAPLQFRPDMDYAWWREN